uniref:Uncharacterized protein n=1 Tax=viral metagenome TaxID=1070528 RepID=A0A6M3MG07_9ZZZZ
MAALFTCGVPKFKIDFYLDNSPKDLKFTDLIAALYVNYGVTVADVRGIIKIVGPSGTIYQNSGYLTDDFSSPDINGNTSTWSKSSIALPVDSDGYVLKGTYTFYYKFSKDAGVSLECTISKSIDYQYTSPTVVIGVTSSCEYSTLTAKDNTVYAITHETVAISPINDLDTDRDVKVQYPITSGQSTLTGHTQSYTAGPNMWGGTYGISVETDLVYNLEAWSVYTWFSVNDTISGETTHTIECDDCSCQVYLCVVNLTEKKVTNVSNKREHDRYSELIDEILQNWMLYQMSERCGYDSGLYCDNIRDIALANGCVCDTDANASKEIIPWAQATSSGSATVNQWYSGAGVPGAGLGVNNDFYLNETTSDVYKKEAGAWVLKLNIKGAAGAAGSAGVTVLENSISDVGTPAGLSETLLKTYTLPGGTLDGDGDMVYIVGIFSMALNANGKYFRLYWGGDLVAEYYTDALAIASSQYLKIEAWVSRTGATAQFIEALKTRSGNPNRSNGLTIATAAKTLASDVIVELKGMNETVPAANDIVAKQLRVELFNKT